MECESHNREESGNESFILGNPEIFGEGMGKPKRRGKESVKFPASRGLSRRDKLKREERTERSHLSFQLVSS